MENDLEVFNALYSDDDNVVFEALKAKKDWMFNCLKYVKGDIRVIQDEKGNAHYPIIESLLDDTLYFQDVEIAPRACRDLKKRAEIEFSLNQSFSFLNLYDDIDPSAPFWIEYDLNEIDDQGYNALFPNYFRKHAYEKWGIDENQVTLEADNVIEQLKYAFIGKEGESIIVMDKDNLLNGVFFAPVVKKIIVISGIDEELKKELKSIAEEKEIEFEEIIYD